jgi:hypothetical protein
MTLTVFHVGNDSAQELSCCNLSPNENLGIAVLQLLLRTNEIRVTDVKKTCITDRQLGLVYIRSESGVRVGFGANV